MCKLWLRFTEVCSQGPIKNISALVQIMAWWRPGDKPLSEPMMVSLLTHTCVTRPQRVKASNIDTNVSADAIILVEQIRPRRDGCQEAIGDTNGCRADWHERPQRRPGSRMAIVWISRKRWHFYKDGYAPASTVRAPERDSVLVGMTASNAPTDDPAVAVTAPSFQNENTSSFTFRLITHYDGKCW